MARLRQQFPQNYLSSGNISTEFENVIRYLNGAELGNKTLGELISQIFNDEGEFDAVVQLRFDPVNGLEYRVGDYENEDEGWEVVVSPEDIRGPAGADVGTVDGPFFYNRQDIEPGVGDTIIDYNFDEEIDDVVVYINGILQPATGVYTPLPDTDQISFNDPFDGTEKVTIYSVRASAVSTYRRSDQTAAPGQVIFPFIHTTEEELLVWRNGLIQTEGAGADYTSNPLTGTITFNVALSGGDRVTIMVAENRAIRRVGGLMTEDKFCNKNGFIRYDQIAIEDDEIPQTKVSGLASAISERARITVSATAPLDPLTGDLWLDTSVMPNVLKFWDGSAWLRTNPSSALPAFTSANAHQYVRLNSTGTAFEYGDIDMSHLVPKTYMGAANGVSTLDSQGRIPVDQMPEVYATQTMPFYLSGSVANGTKFVNRLWKQKLRIDGMAVKLSQGTCTVQLSVDGVAVGQPYAVTTAAQSINFASAIEIDATAAGRRLEIVITNAASTPTDLEIGLACASLTA